MTSSPSIPALAPALALAFALVPPLARSPAHPESEELRGAAEAVAVGGLWGLRTESEVHLAAAPDDPHVLQVDVAFPDRARWTMRRAATTDRRIEYRFGEHGHVLPLSSSASLPLPGPEREAFLRRTRLRQAAFLWPDGARWEGEDERRTALLGALEQEDRTARLGHLEASLDDEGRPVRLQSRDAEGALEETLEILDWQEVAGRAWPRRLRLSFRDSVVWEETVTDVAPGMRLRDRFFVPLDRHALLRAYAVPQRVRLPATWTLGRALVRGDGWEEAAAAAGVLLAEVGDAGPPEDGLGAAAWIACDAGGRPIGIEVRRKPGQGEPPAGWTAHAPRDALRLELGGAEPPSPGDLERLRAAVPEGRTAEAVRAGLADGAILLDLVLVP